MISLENSQLSFQNDNNKEISEKINAFKSTPESIMKEKQSKEVFYIIAKQINSALKERNNYLLQDILVEKFPLILSNLNAYDWPLFDEKSIKDANSITKIYYDILRYKHLSRKDLNYDELKVVFEIYRKFVQNISDNESEISLSNYCLSDVVIHQTYNDYLRVYEKFLSKTESSEDMKYNKEDFEEMYIFLTENLKLTKEIDDELTCEDNINNLNYFCLLNNSFKSTLIEAKLSKFQGNDLIEAINNNKYNSYIEGFKKYLPKIQSKFPIFYIEILLTNMIKDLTQKKYNLSSTDVVEYLKELLKAWEFISTFQPFIRRSYDSNLFNKTFIPTIRNLALIFTYILFNGNLQSNTNRQILSFLNLNINDYEVSEYKSIIIQLDLPFISEWNTELTNYILNNSISLIDTIMIKDLDELVKVEKDLINTMIS